MAVFDFRGLATDDISDLIDLAHAAYEDTEDRGQWETAPLSDEWEWRALSGEELGFAAGAHGGAW